MELSAFSQCQQVWPHSTYQYPLGLLRSYHCHTSGTSRGDYSAMKDDPTIAAIREARHKISTSVNHDPRKLVAHYRELQERHRERLVSRPTPVAERQGENVASYETAGGDVG